MGAGYMSDGSSEETLRASGFWHNQLRKIQEMLKENMDILCETNRQVIIQLNMKEEYRRVCRPAEVFGFKNIKVGLVIANKGKWHFGGR